jgi:PAP_fibrillin
MQVVDDNISRGDDIAIETEAKPVGTDELKRDLLDCVNGCNRGIAASKATRDTVLGIVRELELRGRSWTPPLSGGEDTLVGKWRLVFTNALDVLSLSLLPFLLGQIYQNVESGDGLGRYMIYNEVELEPLFAPVTNAFDFVGDCKSRIRVTAEGVLSGSDEAARVDVTFVRSAVEGVSLFGWDVSGLPKLEVPLNSPVGYIETPYVDETMRIARSPPTPNAPQNNNYFILLRED